jgi:fatty acid desaturase
MDKISIHGIYYDLRNFKHPGGQEILELCKNEPDCSALFESYHVFSDMNKIQTIMKKYEVGKTDKPSLFSFQKNGFYNTLKQRVNDHFQNKSTKWSFNYLGTFISSVGFFALSQYLTFISDNPLLKGLSSFTSGCSMMFLGYNVLHDGSHYAISSYPRLNNMYSSIIQSLIFLNHTLWGYHHVIRHHQYTGMIEYDPDIRNSKPFFRKSNQLSQSTTELSHKYISIKLIVFNIFLPGTLLGQSLLYNLWTYKKYLWKMDLPDIFGSTQDYLQYTISLLYITFYICYAGLPYLYCYIVGLNLLYWIGSAPDHDMYDTHKQIENQKKTMDWGEMQVRHSGNFMESYSLFTRYMGGINYQIEHHLFPSLSNHKLKEIAPIVKQCCKEFNIPYTSVDSPIDVFNQVIDTYKEVHSLKQD